MRRPGFRHEAVCESPDLVALVTETGMSYQQIADELGIASRTLESWLYGHTPTPKIAVLALKHLACGKHAAVCAADDTKAISP